MNQIRMLKPEEAARRAKANVDAFKKEQERKAAEAKLAVKRKPATPPAPGIQMVKTALFPEKQQELNKLLLANVAEGKTASVESLLKEGANPNAKELHGNAPLHYAAKYGYLEIARLLIENGADVGAWDPGMNTALMWAESLGHTEVAKLIKNELNRLLLENAVSGTKGEVERLVYAGADVNAQDRRQRTALIDAAHNGHKEVVELLIEKGADVNARTHLGWTPLKSAAANGHTDIVELLKRHGAKE